MWKNGGTDNLVINGKTKIIVGAAGYCNNTISTTGQQQQPPPPPASLQPYFENLFIPIPPTQPQQPETDNMAMAQFNGVDIQQMNRANNGMNNGTIYNGDQTIVNNGHLINANGARNTQIGCTYSTTNVCINNYYLQQVQPQRNKVLINGIAYWIERAVPSQPINPPTLFNTQFRIQPPPQQQQSQFAVQLPGSYGYGPPPPASVIGTVCCK